MLSNHLFCHPFPFLLSIFPSIKLFSNESALHISLLEYWSFSFSISPSIKYSGLISFRIAWFDFLAVQGTLKSLLQDHNLKASILWCSDFFAEKAMAPYSSTLAWKIPWMEEPGRLQSMGSLRVGHDWETSLSFSCIGEGNGNPLQCSCLENPRDGGAWWAAVYGVAQSRTRLKWLSCSSSSA